MGVFHPHCTSSLPHLWTLTLGSLRPHLPLPLPFPPGEDVWGWPVTWEPSGFPGLPPTSNLGQIEQDFSHASGSHGEQDSPAHLILVAATPDHPGHPPCRLWVSPPRSLAQLPGILTSTRPCQDHSAPAVLRISGQARPAGA